MQRVDSLEKIWCWEGLGAGGEGDDRGWDGWMASLDGREFEWTPGVGDGRGCLAFCDSWGRKESDMTERLNWTELILYSSSFINMHIPPNLLHEYAYSFSLKLLQFCCSRRHCFGKYPQCSPLLLHVINPSPNLCLHCLLARDPTRGKPRICVI